jgi:hypothetical protein
MLSGTRALIAVAGVVAVLAVVGTAVASQVLEQSSGYTGCLTQNGDLLKFAEGNAPLRPCSGNQVEVHFSGDLPTVIAGSGLDGTTAEGVLTLSLNPAYALPQGCAGGQVPRWDGNAWACGNAEPMPLP